MKTSAIAYTLSAKAKSNHTNLKTKPTSEKPTVLLPLPHNESPVRKKRNGIIYFQKTSAFFSEIKITCCYSISRKTKFEFFF